MAMAGQRIGLLGGSFDPPHPGHLHISDWALKAAGLDRVWWLVSPGNPLKQRGPADIDRRTAACRALVGRHPRIQVTDIERHLGSSYTAHTLKGLARRYPGVRFVWLMGADNLASFHRWQRWDWIIESFPILVLGRPEQQLSAGLSPTARRYAGLRVPAGAAGTLGRGATNGWALLTGPMSGASSTAIRGSGAWT
ncbi:MAG: nicotinate-nucleotide adenylyltransferase [Pseudomonadota bacterium]